MILILLILIGTLMTGLIASIWFIGVLLNSLPRL